MSPAKKHLLFVSSEDRATTIEKMIFDLITKKVIVKTELVDETQGQLGVSDLQPSTSDAVDQSSPANRPKKKIKSKVSPDDWLANVIIMGETSSMVQTWSGGKEDCTQELHS